MMFIYNYIYIAYSCCVLPSLTYSYMVHPPQGPLPGRAPGTPFQRNRLYLSIHLSIHPSIYLSIYLSIYHYLSNDRSIYLSISDIPQ